MGRSSRLDYNAKHQASWRHHIETYFTDSLVSENSESAKRATPPPGRITVESPIRPEGEMSIVQCLMHFLSLFLSAALELRPLMPYRYVAPTFLLKNSVATNVVAW